MTRVQGDGGIGEVDYRYYERKVMYNTCHNCKGSGLIKVSVDIKREV